MYEAIEASLPVIRGAETSEYTRNYAFELWATVARHNYAETARITDINEHTLRSWGRRYGWRARALERNLDIAPEELRHATGSILQAAALDGATYLYNVVRGEVEPNRARQQAAIAVCHMAGWAPAHYLPTRSPEPKPQCELPDLDHLSPDELRELERQLTAGD